MSNAPLPSSFSGNNIVKFPKKKIYARSTTGYKSNGGRIPHAADPIPQEILSQIKEYFSDKKYGLRNWTFLIFGINSGNRCGDIGKLRIGDVVGFDGKIKTDVEYMAQKTRTWEHIYIRDELKPDIENYIKTLRNQSRGAWLFPTQNDKPMNSNTYWKVLNEVRTELKLDIHLSTHSMRKTLGRTAYEIYGMDGARELLRHKNNKVTARYIGVTEETVREKALNLPTIK